MPCCGRVRSDHAGAVDVELCNQTVAIDQPRRQ